MWSHRLGNPDFLPGPSVLWALVHICTWIEMDQFRPTFPSLSFSFLPQGMLSGRAHLVKQGSSQFFRATVCGYPSPFLWEPQVKSIENSVNATLSTFPVWGLLIAIHPSQLNAQTTCLQSKSAVPDTSPIQCHFSQSSSNPLKSNTHICKKADCFSIWFLTDPVLTGSPHICALHKSPLHFLPHFSRLVPGSQTLLQFLRTLPFGFPLAQSLHLCWPVLLFRPLFQSVFPWPPCDCLCTVYVEPTGHLVSFKCDEAQDKSVIASDFSYIRNTLVRHIWLCKG